MNYYYLNGQPVGPFTEEQFRQLICREGLGPDTYVLQEGSGEWVRLSSLPEMAEALAELEKTPMGACPKCRADITGFFMPAACPHCGDEMALPLTERENMWNLFVFSMKKSFTLRGRATRMEFWSFVLFSNIILTVIYGVLSIPASYFVLTDLSRLIYEDEALVLWLLAGLFVPSLPFLPAFVSVSVRRLHDIGVTGLWMPAGLLSFFVPLLSLFVMDGTEDETAFLLSYIILCLVPLGVWCRIAVSHFQDTQRGGNVYGPSSKYPH